MENQMIHIDQPVSFEVKGEEHKVNNNRSIYGLKKSSRQQNLKFHLAILSYGFMMIEYHCWYAKRSKNDFRQITLVCWYF